MCRPEICSCVEVCFPSDTHFLLPSRKPNHSPNPNQPYLHHPKQKLNWGLNYEKWQSVRQKTVLKAKADFSIRVSNFVYALRFFNWLRSALKTFTLRHIQNLVFSSHGSLPICCWVVFQWLYLIRVCFQPCHLKDWEMQVHFKIHGQGKKNLNGDGLAIWYTKERLQKGKCHKT